MTTRNCLVCDIEFFDDGTFGDFCSPSCSSEYNDDGMEVSEE